MTKTDQKSDCHSTVFAFSSPSCREDFLFIVMGLQSVINSRKEIFSRGRDLSGIMKRKGTESVCQSMYRYIFTISSSSFPGILRTNLMTSSQLAC